MGFPNKKTRRRFHVDGTQLIHSVLYTDRNPSIPSTGFDPVTASAFWRGSPAAAWCAYAFSAPRHLPSFSCAGQPILPPQPSGGCCVMGTTPRRIPLCRTAILTPQRLKCASRSKRGMRTAVHVAARPGLLGRLGRILFRLLAKGDSEWGS